MTVAPPYAHSAQRSRWQRRVAVLGRRLVGHILAEDGDVFARWRARLIASALLACVTVGVIPFAVTMRVLVVEGRSELVGLHLVGNALLWWLLLSRRPSNALRSMLLTSACFLVGMLSLLTMGFVSAALVWLFASILLSSLLLGVSCTLATVASALVLLFGTGVAIETGRVSWLATQALIHDRWLMITLNFAFVALVCAIGNAIVLQVLANEEQRRRALEARLAEARQHEALGSLASGIAHDFNNLLVPITNGLDGLRDDARLDASARSTLDDAIGSALVARDLVRRVLGFARQNTDARQAVPLGRIVREVCARVVARHTAPVQVTVHDGVHVLGNPAELHQIVDNLIDNAVRAIEEGGAVEVLVDESRMDAGRWVRLVVADTGRGMTAETAARIFEPYFTTRRVGQGTGLGLPIVRSLVTGLGGRIEVESAPGRGTRFTVLLPWVEASGGAAVPDAVTAPQVVAEMAASRVDAAVERSGDASSMRTVLLVDDEYLVRRAVAHQLQRLGHHVVSCASVAEAEDVLRNRAVDIVLTDWRMPERDGFALARTVRDAATLPALVIMSGDTVSAQSDAAWPTEALALQKPFTRAELAHVLDEATHTRRRPAAVDVAPS